MIRHTALNSAARMSFNRGLVFGFFVVFLGFFAGLGFFFGRVWVFSWLEVWEGFFG